MIIGYTTGVFDLFHIGHLNMLKNAKSLCDKLIVGVTTDDLLREYKHKEPIIPFSERCEIVRSIKYVDTVIAQQNMNKFEAWERFKFDYMFVGDDWFKTEKWEEIEKMFYNKNVKIIYFPYTQGTSSTLINQILVSIRDKTF